MAVSKEISVVQEQNVDGACVQFYLRVHFMCVHKI